ncbi:hypothetical protein [Providencia sp. PROV145]|uniref:hypothetical protein n=1 Tax=Providencia sp. PROV145 TaxID=2949855 RepID=UPI002349F1E2
MRVDNRLVRDGLTEREVFFIECWASLSHKDSIDTDRVDYNNILNALNELKYLYNFKTKYKAVEKRARAAEELLGLLESDLVLNQAVFLNITQQIKKLLISSNILKDSGRSAIEKKYDLMESLFNELSEMLEKSYILESLSYLENLINDTKDPTNEDLERICAISNGIMSMMLTLGMPLSECYLLYNRILLGKHFTTFNERYTSWKQKILSPIKDYTVTLTVENDKLHEMLLVDNTSIEFNNCIYTPFTQINGKKATTIQIKTRSISVLAARMKADTILMQSLDVIAYMIGNSMINVHNQFEVIDSDNNTTRIRSFINEINVNQDRLTLSEFPHFINSMRKLYANASETSVKKISSTFHFLRNGVSNHSKESRFTSFWSALESLTLGVSSQENIGHDEHVIYSVIPCMGMDYLVKQIVAIRGIIRYLDLKIYDNSRVLIDFNSINLADVYKILKEENIKNQILGALISYPYAKYMFNKLILICTNPRGLAKKIMSHSAKVTLHIHRLYMLRNAIVHNAESSADIDILTANLEHYLRGTINAMFYTAGTLPKVRSPEEAFVRYHFMYDSLIKELEPTYGLTKESDIRKTENEINNGGIIPSDKKVIAWLQLHA